MEKAGFVNITIQRFKLPIGMWPADQNLREVGGVQLVAMLEGIQGLTVSVVRAMISYLTYTRDL